MRKQKNEINIRSSTAEYLTFVASTGDSAESVEMRYEDENIWLTQKMMAELYNVDVRTINYHIGKVFEDSELEKEATIRKFRIVQSEGSRQISRKKSGRSGYLNGSFIRRSRTFTPQLLTTTKLQKQPRSFSPRSKTRCTLRSTDTLLPR